MMQPWYGNLCGLWWINGYQVGVAEAADGRCRLDTQTPAAYSSNRYSYTKRWTTTAEGYSGIITCPPGSFLTAMKNLYAKGAQSQSRGISGPNLFV